MPRNGNTFPSARSLEQSLEYPLVRNWIEFEVVLTVPILGAPQISNSCSDSFCLGEVSGGFPEGCFVNTKF